MSRDDTRRRKEQWLWTKKVSFIKHTKKVKALKFHTEKGEKAKKFFMYFRHVFVSTEC